MRQFTKHIIPSLLAFFLLLCVGCAKDELMEPFNDDSHMKAAVIKDDAAGFGKGDDDDGQLNGDDSTDDDDGEDDGEITDDNDDEDDGEITDDNDDEEDSRDGPEIINGISSPGMNGASLPVSAVGIAIKTNR